jgi:beta-dihydromenaquinone-9 omega-hydroxylase
LPGPPKVRKLAGNETTTNLLSTLFLTLAERPDQLALLQDPPELIPSAIEEQLRYLSPIQSFFRTARADYTVGNATIPARSRVLLLWGAANRDLREYDDPDTFGADRNPTGHLAFGSGAAGTGHESRPDRRHRHAGVVDESEFAWPEAT